MDLNLRAAQDSLFLMELCKDPADVFGADTPERALAQGWLDKLRRLTCFNLAERRRRNVYLSALCACLNKKRLLGPFLEDPVLAKLVPFDFVNWCPIPNEGAPAPTANAAEPMKTEAQPESLTAEQTPSPAQSQLNGCPAKIEPPAPQAPSSRPKCAECVSPKKAAPAPVPLCCAAAAPNPADCVEVCCGGQKSSGVPVHCNCAQSLNQVFVDTYRCSKFAPPPCTYMTQVSQCFKAAVNPPVDKCNGGQSLASTLKCSELRRDISVLLQSIAGELRGEREPGASAYLESELSRYQGYLLQNSTEARRLGQHQPKSTWRASLLLYLQRDLIRLLSESH